MSFSELIDACLYVLVGTYSQGGRFVPHVPAIEDVLERVLHPGHSP
jgi:hypothetical protein